MLTLVAAKLGLSVLSVLSEDQDGLGWAEPSRILIDHLVKSPDLLEKLSIWADGLPQGLLHVDNGPQNAGWREDGHDLLWFDWHKVAIGCTAIDLLTAFPDLAQRWEAADDEVIRAYQAITGDATDFRSALPRLAFISRLNTLTWHLERCRDGGVDWTEDRAEGRATYRQWTARLLDDLVALTSTLEKETLPC